MNTADSIFIELGFAIWQRWDSCVDIPNKTGVYVFRLNREFSRLKGTTDILYIGSTESTLKKRLKPYRNPGSNQLTNIRLNRMLKMEEYKNIEISWCIEKKDKVKDIKKKLLARFDEEHHELPPWNRQG